MKSFLVEFKSRSLLLFIRLVDVAGSKIDGTAVGTLISN
jgi:hypothetical protein